MSRDDNEIEERFGTSISEENLVKYNDLRSQRNTVAGILFLISLVILFSLAYISLMNTGGPYLVFGLLGTLFLLLVVGQRIQNPFFKRIENTGVNRKTLLQHELDSAADAFNENNYEKVIEHLNNIDDEIHSNSNYFMGRDQDLQTYIRRLRNRDSRSSKIEDTFPTIAQILISEQVNKRENTEELNTILDELQRDDITYGSASIMSIYKEEVSDFLTRERIGIIIVMGYFTGVLITFFIWNQELAGILAASGIGIGLLLNILGIIN